MKSRLLRTLFLAGFLLLTFGLLHIAGPQHNHQYGQEHSDCQLCHATSQPYLAPPDAPLVSFSMAIRYLLPERSDRVHVRSYSPYGARAPPSA